MEATLHDIQNMQTHKKKKTIKTHPPPGDNLYIERMRTYISNHCRHCQKYSRKFMKNQRARKLTTKSERLKIKFLSEMISSFFCFYNYNNHCSSNVQKMHFCQYCNIVVFHHIERRLKIMTFQSKLYLFFSKIYFLHEKIKRNTKSL